eukprot:scaffold14253_cov72-Cyclotella_meneghiniana.AAC.5
MSRESPTSRQENHRIYLQVFAPYTASHTKTASSAPSNSAIRRHDSHQIHPPSYPITTPGAPYQFPSSDSSTSASYTFSSVSTAPAHSNSDTSTAVPTDAHHVKHNKANKSRYVSYPSTSTTSAAVRLTDRAKSKDVTALLRGKFGLPPISINIQSTDRNVSHMQQVISSRSAFNSNTSRVDEESTEEVDVLVLVGTIERPPRGYIRFEHEEMVEERVGTPKRYASQQAMTGKTDMPVSASADTVKASGKDARLDLLDNLSSGLTIGQSFSGGSDVTNIGASSTLGLDISSSRGGNAHSTHWGSVAGTGIDDSSRHVAASEVPHISKSSSEVVTANNNSSTSPSKPKPINYEYDSEPIHLIRTLNPDEYPFQVRDEMMKALIQLRQKAATEVGLVCDEDKSESLKQLSFRWFFQPCSALGGNDGSSVHPKIQSIPSYIDLEGYCTGEDESDESIDSDSDDSTNDAYECKVNECLSPNMKKLARERRHIAVLRDLNDPTFIVSGYLLLRSRCDPNVWRRVYCVLGQDKLWIIRRMKALSNLPLNENTWSSLRLGQHSYVKLHRSLLIESGGADSPLGRRLPNSFRIVPLNGSYYTFRAFNAPSFRIWASSLAEKITLKHCDGLMDLANVIAEDEVVARCKRLDDVAISPLLNKLTLSDELSSDLELPPLSADITRFGICVSEYRQLCRHAANALQPQRRMGSPRHNENAGLVSAVWEDARVIASKSAQLLHTFSAQQHDKSSEQGKSISLLMETLLIEQKALQTRLGKRWDSIHTSPNHYKEDSSEDRNQALPPMNLFDSLLDVLQSVCAAMM